MASEPRPVDPARLGEERERAIAQLSDAFAHDIIDVDEFERRITLAHAASTSAEVATAVADLEAPALPVAWTPSPIQVSDSPRADFARVMAVFGGLERRGRWMLPRQLDILAIFGGAVLDFREAVLAPGVTEIHVTAVMGGVQIIVPPTLSVEIAGSAIMGGFDHLERVPQVPDPGRPVLRVHGFAFMGGVAIETRLPGESERDAHRRRRREHKALRRGHEPRRLPEKSR
jgi:hypothetical protein